MEYTKQPITLAEQIEILKRRGLIFDDEAEATETLRRISYFRLAAYWRPMEMDSSSHIFRKGSRFAMALALYQFDNNLKALLFRAIQTIEVAVRTQMIQHFSMKFVGDLKLLLLRYPTVNPAAMGFPAHWRQEPLWQL